MLDQSVAAAAGEPSELPAPLTAEQTANLYDQLLQAQVVACVNVDALYQLQQLVQLHVISLNDLDDREANEAAISLIDRALSRLPGDLRCFLSIAAAE